VSNDISKDKKLDILHDHYKETFSRIKEVESSRDKTFIWLIALFSALILQISYPIAVGKAIGKISIFGTELNISVLPLPAILDVTWLLTLVIGLKYCQNVTFVNRQYPYLHSLEDVISPELGGGDLYRREGHVYLKDFPIVLDIAWFFYGFFFPITIMSAALWLMVLEKRHGAHPSVFDIIVALALFAVFFIYRVLPTIIYVWKSFGAWIRGGPTTP